MPKAGYRSRCLHAAARQLPLTHTMAYSYPSSSSTSCWLGELLSRFHVPSFHAGLMSFTFPAGVLVYHGITAATSEEGGGLMESECSGSVAAGCCLHLQATYYLFRRSSDRMQRKPLLPLHRHLIFLCSDTSSCTTLHYPTACYHPSPNGQRAMGFVVLGLGSH